MRATLLFGSIALALAFTGLAEGQDGSHGNTGPLPPPPATAKVFAGAPPAIPFESIGNQAGSMRTVFKGPGPGNLEIEIRELIVGPRTMVRLEALPGPTLVNPRSGEGTLKTGDHTARLDIANVVSGTSSVPLEFQNTSDAPLVLTLYLVEAR
jgi:hypothetical protein